VMLAPPWPLRPAPVVSDRDDFDLDELRPYWVSLRERRCTTRDRPGWLTLGARGGSLDDLDVVFVGRRQQHLSCEVRTLIDPADGVGGLAVRLDERHHYEVEAASGEVKVFARVGTLRTVVASRSVPAGPIVLTVRITATPPSYDPRGGPDTVSFGVDDTTLAELDGRYLSTEVAGGFTGRVIGMYASTGTVHFDWFDYRPLDAVVPRGV